MRLFKKVGVSWDRGGCDQANTICSHATKKTGRGTVGHKRAVREKDWRKKQLRWRTDGNRRLGPQAQKDCKKNRTLKKDPEQEKSQFSGREEGKEDR